MYDAGAGNTISGVCIKDGNDAFGMSQHSGLITNPPLMTTIGDGDVDDTCYKVTFSASGQTVTVEETGADGCMNVSHVDFFTSDGVPPGSFVPVGGEFIGVDTTAVLAAGAQNTAAWMIPVIIAAAGLGIVIARKF